MSYAEGIQEFIDRCNNAMPPDFYKSPVEEQRRLYLSLTDEFYYDLPDKVAVRDETLDFNNKNIPIRIYTPEHLKGDGLIIYIRGGGFVVGSLETHNTVVAELAHFSGLIAIAVDFRMAPEHPFPAALEDCFDALCGIVEQADNLGINPDKIVISGDSSGANMAVSLSMMCRDRNGPKVVGQALISPVLDFTRWRDGGDDSPLLTGGEMEYYTACYVPEADNVKHPYVSPLVSGTFEKLPPAYIMGAEMDSLLVDSQSYAKNLRQNNIDVEIVVEEGLVHSAVRARGLAPRVQSAWEIFCRKAGELAMAESS